MKLSINSARWARASAMLFTTLTLQAGAAQAQQLPGNNPEQPKPGNDSGPPHRPPPSEALAACNTLKIGDACSFRGREQELKGSCWAPQGKALACHPNNRPEPPKDASAKR